MRHLGPHRAGPAADRIAEAEVAGLKLRFEHDRGDRPEARAHQAWPTDAGRAPVVIVKEMGVLPGPDRYAAVHAAGSPPSCVLMAEHISHASAEAQESFPKRRLASGAISQAAQRPRTRLQAENGLAELQMPGSTRSTCLRPPLQGTP